VTEPEPIDSNPLGLLTESHRPELADLDLRSPLALVQLMNAEDACVAAAVAAVAEPLARAIAGIIPRVAAGGRLIYQGAGSAGRIGVLDAAECGPTFNTDRVVGLIAGGPRAIAQAVEEAEDRYDDGASDLRELAVGPADVVVGVSASGRTPYVLGGIEYAGQVGALTIGLACNPNAALSARVDEALEVVVGPEVIAGSTRLKAGTAQKLVLNTISTVVMVKLKKTYGNLMIDVRATNSKLRRRAIQILVQATRESPTTVQAALTSSGNDLRIALVMLLASVDAEQAERCLAECDGDARRAVTMLGTTR
jgi:N-acetylmuramic acid 6-phosphate etherase